MIASLYWVHRRANFWVTGGYTLYGDAVGKERETNK